MILKNTFLIMQMFAAVVHFVLYLNPRQLDGSVVIYLRQEEHEEHSSM